MTPNLLAIADAFGIKGPATQITPLGRGLINDTYRVRNPQRPGADIVLQRINTHVFHEPALIMANIVALNEANRAGGGVLKIPSLVPTREGLWMQVDADKGYWRALTYIPGTQNIPALQNLDQARNVGRALGLFHLLLGTLAISKLHTTLPGFHIAPAYLAEYDAVSRDASVLRPPDEWADCAAAVERGRAQCAVLENAKNSGVLQVRATHGDPKLDNFLFDDVNGDVVGLIDLDTLQPGLIHYDIGDCIRSCCNISGESVSDLNAVKFDLDACAAILRGYCDAAKSMLSEADYALMYDAVRLIPWELGLRFLTDHLAGDRYFKVQTRGQNLHRARVQFQLCAAIERQRPAILSLIEELSRL